jgi:TetR/AcrR family transcriptional regulator, transcriptional repressor for nem operon
MVGRPRNFDEADALEDATELFWRQGYESTSVSDLLDHMRISRQSLYNTFGGKAQLFHRVLEHYVETRLTRMFAGLERLDADLRSIETYFDTVARGTTVPGSVRKGCLMVNTVVELANQDGATAGEMKQFMKRMEKAMLNALQGAEKAGQLKRGLNLPGAATFLATMAQGMLVVCKVGVSRQQQRATTQLAVAAVRA